MRALFIGLAVVSFVLSPGGVAQDGPKFVAGDVGNLLADVTDAEPVAKDVPSTILTVGVENKGKLAAEPLAFRITPKKGKNAPAPIEVWRVELPHYGRAGRAITPGGRVEYPLLVPFESKVAKGAKIEVIGASFSDTNLAIDEPVKVLRLKSESGMDQSLGRTTRRTRVELANGTEHEIDAIFRAKYTRPKKAETLLEFRLAPGETKEVLVAELPVSRGQNWSEADIRSLELVDWSAVASRGEEEARELFGRAYEAWYRLPGTSPGVRGRFHYAYEQGEEVLEATGAFHVAPGGEATVDFHETVGFEEGPGVGNEIKRAFRDITRPPLEEALKDVRVELVRLGSESQADVVRIDPAALFDFSGALYVGLQDNRIAWTSSGLDPKQREKWQTRAMGDRWVLTHAQQLVTYQPRPQATWRTLYAFEGEAILPVDFQETWGVAGFDDLASTKSLRFEDVVIGEPTFVADPPTGEVADALRAAWEATYRYPDHPVTLSGHFEVKSPGTDGVWMRQRKVAGTFRLEGFRGTRWRRGSVEIAGKDLTDDDKGHLADAVLDRFLLFSGRDFAGRGSFEQAFAGAELVVDAGAIRVTNAALRGIELRDGNPASIELGGGLVRSFDFARVGKALVAVKTRTGDETITATWTDVGKGWLFPKLMRFERSFGKDWGPETLTLSKLRVED